MNSESQLGPAQRDLLLDLASLVSERRNVTEIFATFAEELLRGASFDFASLMAYEDDDRFVRVLGGFPEAAFEGQPQVFNDRFVGIRVLANYPDGVEIDPLASGFDVVRSMADSGIRRMWTVPLLDADGCHGSFTVGSASDRPFPDEEMRFLRLSARLLTGAVRDETRVAHARREAARSQVVNELALLLSAGEPVNVVFERLAELMSQAVAFDYMTLVVLEADGEYRRVGSRPEIAGAIGEVVPSAPQTVANMIESGLPSFEFRPDRYEGERSQELAANGLRRVAANLLVAGGNPVGFLSIGRKKNLAFRADDLRFMETVTALVGQAVAGEQRTAALAREADERAVLNELAILLNAGQPVDALFVALPPLLEPVISFDYIGLMVAAGRPGLLRMVGSSPPIVRPAGTLVPFEVARVDDVLATGETTVQYRPEFTEGESSEAFRAAGIERVLTVLLQQGEETLGMFTLARRDRRHFSAEELRFIDLVTTMLRQAVANQLRIGTSEAEAARGHLLNELAILLNAGMPVEAFFQRVLDLLNKALRFDYLALAVLDSESPGQYQSFGFSPASGRTVVSLISAEELNAERMLAAPGSVIGHRFGPDAGPASERFLQNGFVRGTLVPFREGGRLLGVLHLAHQSEFTYVEEERRFLEIVGTFFTQAISQRERLSASGAEAARSRLLNDMAILLNRGEELSVIFSQLSKELRTAVPFDALSLMVHEGDGGMYTVASERDRVLPVGTRASLAEWGVDYRTFSTGRVLRYDVSQVPAPLAKRLTESGLVEVATAIMAERGEFLGSLNIGRGEGEGFSSQELEFIAVVGTLLGEALAHNLRLERTRQEAEEQRLIADVAAVAAREHEPRAIIAGLIEPIGRIVPRPFIAFGYVEGTRLTWVDRDQLVEQEMDDLTSQVLVGGQLAVPNLREVVPADHPAHALGIEAGSCTPAHGGGHLVGVLAIDSRERGHTFGERELRLFRLFAQIIGPAMENARAAGESEAQRRLYELALSSLTDAVILVDHELRGTYANPSGHRIIEALAPSGGIMDALERLTPDAAAALRLAITGGSQEHGRTSLTLDGKLIWLDFDILPLRHPQYRFVIVASDVTSVMQQEEEEQRHRALMSEAAAQVERERATYNLALNSLSEAVVLLDHDYKPVFANEKGRAIVSLIDPELPRDGAAETAAQLPQAGLDALRRSSRTRERTAGRTSVVVNGEMRWVDFEFIPLEHPNLAMLAVASDVTDVVERDAERERHREQIVQASRLAALGELIGGVAHELNNPLTAILGFTEMISATPGAAGLAEDLGVIHKEALRARNIVRDLLFIARPGPVDRTNVDLREVIAHIERLRRGAWRQSGVEATVDADELDVPVLGNEHQLTQVLLNLVTNAEQALAGRPGARMTIRGRLDGDRAVIEVEDNGAGMEDAVRGRIFEPFFTTKHGAGTGLGLSLSYTMVRSHDGTLEAESTPGEGSLFRISLPVHAGVVPADSDVGSADMGRKRRVLVVDDEPSLRRVCQRLLASLGHECETAATSAEATDWAKKSDFDLVLCDYRLASESADAVMESFLRVRPGLVQRTVIATGATTDAGVMELTQKHGLRLMAKPYGLAEISALVSAIPSANGEG